MAGSRRPRPPSRGMQPARFQRTKPGWEQHRSDLPIVGGLRYTGYRQRRARADRALRRCRGRW